jgi:hypothetical protein
MQKRIVFLFVALLLFLTLFPVLYLVEDDGLLKDTPAYRAYSHLATALNIAYDFDYHPAWTRNFSMRDTLWYIPSVLYPSTETRAPPT